MLSTYVTTLISKKELRESVATVHINLVRSQIRILYFPPNLKD